MDLRQLRSLVALADERHFTRAAARLHIAQPALSQQLRRLEDELGLVLVDRTTRRVALTDAGDALVVRARAALAEIDAAHAEMQERTGLVTGTLTVGITQTPGPFDLPALLARFHGRAPGIRLAVREGLSRTLADDLRADVLDVAFITEPVDVQGLDVEPLVSEPLVLAVAPEHPLARRAAVGTAALRGERFVAFRDGATIRAAVDRSATHAGFAPDIAFETDDVMRMRALVAEGLGVAVLPRSDAARPGPAVVPVRLADRSLVHRISRASRAGKRHAPATRAFLGVAGDAARAEAHSHA